MPRCPGHPTAPVLSARARERHYRARPIRSSSLQLTLEGYQNSSLASGIAHNQDHQRRRRQDLRVVGWSVQQERGMRPQAVTLGPDPFRPVSRAIRRGRLCTGLSHAPASEDACRRSPRSTRRPSRRRLTGGHAGGVGVTADNSPSEAMPYERAPHRCAESWLQRPMSALATGTAGTGTPLTARAAARSSRSTRCSRTCEQFRRSRRRSFTSMRRS